MKKALNIDGNEIPVNAPGALYQIETEDQTTEQFKAVIQEGAAENIKIRNAQEKERNGS